MVSLTSGHGQVHLAFIACVIAVFFLHWSSLMIYSHLFQEIFW